MPHQQCDVRAQSRFQSCVQYYSGDPLLLKCMLVEGMRSILNYPDYINVGPTMQFHACVTPFPLPDCDRGSGFRTQQEKAPQVLWVFWAQTNVTTNESNFKLGPSKACQYQYHPSASKKLSPLSSPRSF